MQIRISIWERDHHSMEINTYLEENVTAMTLQVCRQKTTMIETETD